jgi:hypothetical protein
VFKPLLKIPVWLNFQIDFRPAHDNLVAGVGKGSLPLEVRRKLFSLVFVWGGFYFIFMVRTLPGLFGGI